MALYARLIEWVPAMVCGPGSILQAHKADEFVTLEQLARCNRFIDGLIGAAAFVADRRSREGAN